MPKVGGRRVYISINLEKSKKSEIGRARQRIIYSPKAFVFKCGKCTETCKDLSLDFRKCFYPHTAMKL